MTNKLEKHFFDTFGIEARKVKICRNINYCPKKYKLCNDDCKHWQVIRIDYPEITDRILLELFDILRKYYNLNFWTIDNSFVMDMRDKSASYTNVLYRTGGDLKESILSSLNLVVKQNFIDNDTIKHQVRTLFEEG